MHGMRKPLQYQRPILEWARLRRRIALFIEMRLGKSFITITWALSLLRSNDLVLIVGPSAPLPGWQQELALFGIRSHILVGSSSDKRLQFEREYRDGCRWFMITPEGLRAAPDLCEYRWKLCVLDESTFIANPKNEITKLVHKRLNTPLKAILTGTPAPEHDLQYFEQMRWLHGDFCGFESYWGFRAHCWHQAGYEWFPNRGVKEMYTKEIAKNAYVLTAEQAGIPNRRVYETRYCELPAFMRRSYSRVMEEYATGDLMTRFIPVARTWLAQIAGGCLPKNFRTGKEKAFTPHKFVELERLLEGELHRKPVVVFFRFNREIAVAAERLRARGFKLGLFHGLTPPAKRQQIVEDFQQGRLNLLLAQGRAARFGLDFHRASAEIFFSNWLDWQTRSQLEARIRHPKKKEPALYIDIVTRGTVDEAYAIALREKERSSMALLQRIYELHRSLAA